MINHNRATETVSGLGPWEDEKFRLKVDDGKENDKKFRNTRKIRQMILISL